MHSRIFEIRNRKFEGEFEANAEKYTDCDDTTGFIGSVAEYVADTNDRIADIKWLSGYISHNTDLYEINIDNEEDKFSEVSIKFKAGFKKEMLRRKFESFKKAASELTLDSFTDNYVTYCLKTNISDKFGFYFDMYGLYTTEDFVREIIEEKTYYIGGVIDYHA